MALGLSNGTHQGGLGDNTSSNSYLVWSSGYYDTNVGSTTSASVYYDHKSLGVTTDSTKSGVITDLSNITTALDCYYYIVAATSTKTNIEVDIDEIATDLNGKADADLGNCTKPYVIDTYVNGTSWWRLWSDNWCEQGGITSVSTSLQTVNFLKTFANTNYTVTLGDFYNGVSGGGVASCASISSKTASSMQISQVSGNSRRAHWYVCGYIS